LEARENHKSLNVCLNTQMFYKYDFLINKRVRRSVKKANSMKSTDFDRKYIIAECPIDENEFTKINVDKL
jgi:hypothetical protein